MNDRQVEEFSDREIRQLLIKLEQMKEEKVRPLVSEEVQEIEATYQPRVFSTERESRHRSQLEELRQEWLSDITEIESLFSRGNEIGVSRERFAHQLRIDLSVLLKLELRLVTDPPLRLIRRVADLLDVDIRSIVSYLTQPGSELEQVAASSQGKPAAGQPQTWEEAVLSSNMSDEDKEFWLGTAARQS